MEHSNPRRNTFESRPEYNQSIEDKLEECNLITDIVDDFLTTHAETASVESNVTTGPSNLLVNRLFRYIESNEPDDDIWPLTEKIVDISYSQTRDRLFTEVYRVHIGTLMHRPHRSLVPISNIYEITYFGKNRSSVTTTLMAPNLTEPNEGDFAIRPTTPYDHSVLFNDLMSLNAFLEAEKNEGERDSQH